MKNTFRRIIAGILMVAMILPITALAAEYNLDDGDITIEASGSGDTYIQNVTQNQTTTQDAAPVITQSSESTSNTITVNAAGSTATVTIQNVNIEAQGKAAITTTGDVTIQVSGENTVSSDGIGIDAEGSLTITSAPETEDSNEPAPVENDNEGSQNQTENSLTVEGDITAINVTGDNASDGTLTIGNVGSDDENKDDSEVTPIGNGDSDDENKDDIEVTAIGGEVGIDANVTIQDAAVEIVGNNIGVDGNVTVNDGNVIIENDDLGRRYSDCDIGVWGNLTVNNGTVSVTNNNYGVGGDVTVTGGTVEVSNGPNTTEGVAICGDLDVMGGNVTVYGYDTGVMGEVSVTGDGTASIHSYGCAVSSEISAMPSLTLHDQNHKLDNCNHPACNQTMIFAKHDDGTFDIHGVYTFTDDYGNEKSVPQQTTFFNDGYRTYLQIQNSSKFQVEDLTGETDTNGLNIAIDLVPKKDGKVLQVVYTVKNKGDAPITFSLGSCADVQIGNDDSAEINVLRDKDGNAIGLKMVDDDYYDGVVDAQFNFFGKNDADITDIDTFWYGYYGSADNCVFDNVTSYEPYKSDSGLAWSWKDRTVGAGETLTFTVLIGIGGKGSEGVAGGVVVPDSDDDTSEGGSDEAIPEPVPAPAPAAPSSQLTIKLDVIEEVIDLEKGTQNGQPMEKIEVQAELTSGKTMEPDSAVVVCKAETTADETVEDITKENVALAFTVAYLRKGVVSNLPGKVNLSIPAPADSLEGYVLVFVQENGKQIEIPYELVDGKIVFATNRIGLYMLVKN